MESREHPTEIYGERMTLLQVRVSSSVNMTAGIDASSTSTEMAAMIRPWR
jgi:hypothetical protein